MAKRGRRGQGSVYQRASDKLWVAQVTVKKERQRAYARTKEEARAKLAELRNPRNAPAMDATQTLAAYLSAWYRDEVEDTIAYGTQISYLQGIRQISRHIGDVRLCDLNQQHVAHLYHSWRDELAAGTVRRNHTLLKRALKKAVEHGHIPANPLDGRRVPHDPIRELEVYDEHELRLLIEGAAGTRWAALWMALGSLGLRISEALGLQWTDIDWDARRLRVVRSQQYRRNEGYVLIEQKTGASRRTLMLASSEVEAFRAHREVLLRTRKKPFSDHGLIFPRPDGRPMNTAVCADNLDRQADTLGLRRVRLHDLRHSAATILLKHGVPIKVVSEMLGHGDVLITLRTYAHVTEGMQEAAASRREEIWKGTAERGTLEGNEEARNQLPSVG